MHLKIINIQYLFSSPVNTQWQQISNFKQNAYGQLKLSDTTYFILGVDPLAPYSLHLYKLSFGSTSPDWALKLAWQSGTCTTSYSESLLVSSSIFSFFPYGSSKYLYMAVISVTDGSVSSRYKSTISCNNLYGSGVSGDYIVASVQCPSLYYLLVLNKATYDFDIKSYSGSELFGIWLEPITGR